jgi:hypothetical protein
MSKGTKPCTVDGCDRLGHGGLCGAHAQRLRTHGSVGSPQIRRQLPNGTPTADKIDIIGWTVAESGCWEWNGRQGVRNGTVYGRVDDEQQVARLAHRIAYVKWVGPLDDDLVLMHRCDNPICINPEHLEPGTQAENLADMMQKGRAFWQKEVKTHCIHGHELTEDNVYWVPRANGRKYRRCRTCQSESAKRRAA